MTEISIPKHYISFLLRLWTIDSRGETAWRVMVENPHTHEVRGFDNLEAFYNYLQKITAEAVVDPNNPDHFAVNS